jgi:hypothetical protein
LGLKYANKTIRYDCFFETDSPSHGKTSYIVEMEAGKKDDFNKRAVYYASRAYVRLDSGADYKQLCIATIRIAG